MSSAVTRCAVALSLLALAAAAAGCGGTVVDRAKLEATMRQSLEGSLHEKIKSVECPSDQPVDPGSTFTCDVSFTDGQRKAATLEIRNKDADISIVGLKPAR